jgi:hypothetical protein
MVTKPAGAAISTDACMLLKWFPGSSFCASVRRRHKDAQEMYRELRGVARFVKLHKHRCTHPFQTRWSCKLGKRAFLARDCVLQHVDCQVRYACKLASLT